MYEHRKHNLLSRHEFAKRVLRHGLVALLIVSFSLGLGVTGYHYLAELSWIDALLANAPRKSKECGKCTMTLSWPQAGKSR